MNEIFDPYVLQHASCRASSLVASAGLRPSDWEDLRQDILLDLLSRGPRFDPQRGDWQGFVHGVARNHSTVLIGRYRRRGREVLASDLLDRESTDKGDPLATIENRHYCDPTAELHLRLDIGSVVANLPAHLQVIARLLAHMSVQDVCERTGKSRSSFYRMTLQLREAFVAAGLAPSGAAEPAAREISVRQPTGQERGSK